MPLRRARQIVVDAFDVTTPGRRYQEEDPAVVYSPGNWIFRNRNRTWSEGTVSESTVAGAKLTFTFTGTSVSWIGCRKLSTGTADVFLDGVLVNRSIRIYRPRSRHTKHRSSGRMGLATRHAYADDRSSGAAVVPTSWWMQHRGRVQDRQGRTAARCRPTPRTCAWPRPRARRTSRRPSSKPATSLPQQDPLRRQRRQGGSRLRGRQGKVRRQGRQRQGSLREGSEGRRKPRQGRRESLDEDIRRIDVDDGIRRGVCRRRNHHCQSEGSGAGRPVAQVSGNQCRNLQGQGAVERFRQLACRHQQGCQGCHGRQGREICRSCMRSPSIPTSPTCWACRSRWWSAMADGFCARLRPARRLQRPCGARARQRDGLAVQREVHRHADDPDRRPAGAGPRPDRAAALRPAGADGASRW